MKPANVDHTIGLRSRFANFARWSMIHTPSVNCRRFEIVNSALPDKSGLGAVIS